MKYKVGDKVRVRNDLEIGRSYLMENGGGDSFVSEMAHFQGKVVTICACDGEYSIKEDNEIWGWTDEMFVGLAEFNKKIVITTDGTEALARLYEDDKVVKSATAKCSPEDEFDFNIGARLAFDRLIESTVEKKEEYYNGRTVCVESPSCFAYTVGKIYEFKNGQLVNDNGYKIPTIPAKTLDDWHERCGIYAKLVALVEEKKGE